MVTTPSYPPAAHAEPSHVTVVVGASPSGGRLMSTNCECVASALLFRSHERNFNVVGVMRTIGSVYSGLLSVGSEPSVVYRVVDTPVPRSVADRVALTTFVYCCAEHAAALHSR